MTRLESGAAPIIINVNRHVVKANEAPGCDVAPVLSARRGRSGAPVYGTTIRIVGEVEFRYEPNRPLPCGARVWAECRGVVEVS